MKKNEKVFRVPKNYFLFLAIKTFDRCQKERKRRRENRVRALNTMNTLKFKALTSDLKGSK